MTMARSTRADKPGKRKVKRSNAGPISFFVSLFIVALGAIQLVSTFHTYALNLAELNSLKREEAALEEQLQDLENQIDRWDDEAYVTAQARERLGFVFPGEQAVKVEHPEAVTGTTEDDEDSGDESSSAQTLPWYEELEYSFEQADKRDATADDDDAGTDTAEAADDSSGSTDGSGTDSDDATDGDSADGTDGES